MPALSLLGREPVERSKGRSETGWCLSGQTFCESLPDRSVARNWALYLTGDRLESFWNTRTMYSGGAVAAFCSDVGDAESGFT